MPYDEHYFDLLVIGLGASGASAAIAAREAGFLGRIAILEKEKQPLRKVLASGNGRCNLVNTQPIEGHYHGTDPSFASAVIAEMTAKQLLSWFFTLGLHTMEDREGRVYPRSFQASSVALILQEQLERHDVKIFYPMEVVSIEKENFLFQIKTKEKNFTASAVIVATGSAAAPDLGGSLSGLDLLQSMGHTLRLPMPSLVPLNLNPHPLMKYASGIRFRGKATFVGHGGETAKTKGEFLITSYGLSGIAAMELGRIVGRIQESPAGHIYLDFVPEMTEDEMLVLLKGDKNLDRDIRVALTGLVPEKIAKGILRSLHIEEPSKKDDNFFKKMASLLKALPLEVQNTRGFPFAQVASGGVLTDEFDASTLMSKKVSELFSSGEVLDIDGDTGGYNLLWAFSSGYRAGKSAAEYLMGQKRL
ncbi:MAG: aminoacetone oxidase family FAD-binding enzyme [Eubacteriales bacterium]|nr:aminoacetone oxidase family FAD-binding enzyme [Eubacteriales bacterium]